MNKYIFSWSVLVASSVLIGLNLIQTSESTPSLGALSWDSPSWDDIEDSDVGKFAGDVAEETTGARSTQDVQENWQAIEDSPVGKYLGDVAEKATGARSMQEFLTFNKCIPFVIPVGAVPVPACLNLKADVTAGQLYATVSVAGVEIRDVIPSQDKITATLAPSINQISTDFTGIDIVGELEKITGQTIGELASVKMVFTADWSVGQAYNDMTICYKEFKEDVDVSDLTQELNLGDIGDLDNKIGGSFDSGDEDKGLLDISDNCKTERYYLNL